MLTRREFVGQTAQLGAVIALPTGALKSPAREGPGVAVNDIQSQLNATRVHRIVQPTSIDAIQAALRDAQREGRAVSVAGGRHAMGGQQFGRDSLLLDMKRFNRVVSFDKAKGHIEVEGGLEWPELIEYLSREQAGQRLPWAIREKQTGVDRVSLGGSLASNIHGRGLRFPPIISDVESLVLVDAQGKLRACSRRENQELFALAIGGYGLFGVIAYVRLRLAPRTKVQRVVEVIAVKDLLSWVEKRLQQGFVYGDCQYSTDLETDAQAHRGCSPAISPWTATLRFPKAKSSFQPRIGPNFIRWHARTRRKRSRHTPSITSAHRVSLLVRHAPAGRQFRGLSRSRGQKAWHGNDHRSLREEGCVRALSGASPQGLPGAQRRYDLRHDSLH